MVMNREPTESGGGGPPIFNAPRSVVWLIGLLIAIHLVRALLPADWDREVLYYFAFFPAKYAAGSSIPWLEKLIAFVSHLFLHGDTMHVGFNSIWLLALGTPVARRLPTRRFLGLFLICGILGALVHLVLFPMSRSPMIGASGAIAAMMGAAVRFALFVPGGYAQGMRFGFPRGWILPLSDRRILAFTGVWMAINLFIGLSGGPFSSPDQSIAWDVHIAGYVAGLLLFPVFDRWKGGGNGASGGPDNDRPSHLRRVK
jgi:membrane associated rhomboid family serine protease